MNRLLYCLCLGVCLALAPARAAPLDAYGHLPEVENMAITPDGKVLAYATDVGGKRTVIVYSIDASKLLAALVAGDQKLRDLRWADNDHLLITISNATYITGVIGPKQEYAVSEVYSLAENVQKPLLRELDNSLNVTLGAPISRNVNGHTVVFVHGIHFRDNVGVTALFSTDLVSGRSQIVEPGTKRSDEWLLDDSGNVIAGVEYDNDSRLWSLKLLRNDQWTTAYSVSAAIDFPSVLGITADGKAIELRMIDADGNSVKSVNLADGSVNENTDENAGLGDPVLDPTTHRIIGTEAQTDHTEYHFTSRDDQLAWNSVAQAFSGENVALVSWSADRSRVIVLVDGTTDGSEYQLVDLNTHMAHPLGPAYPEIHPSDVAAVKFIHYAAADGTTIPAILTLPNGREAKNLPLIVFPHGGPLARDLPGFDWWAQAMASRGYAVLQPQFRGSDGFGWKHASAGFGEWGRKMQTDLSDGVRYLAGQGLIDAKRVCIVGASYGGYAALAGPTLDRGVYRCAVAVAGVSDPQTFLRWVEHRERDSDTASIRFWTRFMGVKDSDDPKLADISPLAHAASDDVPVLLIHGSDDTVVPMQQSNDMNDALLAAGKPVTYVKLKSEDHWLSRSETREQMLEALVNFLEVNNPPN